MQNLIIKIIPIILCLLFGMLFKKKNLLSTGTIDDLKFLVINVALPFVLFQAFSRAELSLSLLFIPIAVFLLCVSLFLIGVVVKKYLLKEMHYSPFFFTGFEFGMIGSALILSLFGIKAIESISLVIIGHELFIWFVYFPLIESGNRSVTDILHSSLRSPILIAIVTALIINIIGLADLLKIGFLGSLVETITQTFANLIAPLILFIIGYNMNFTKDSIRQTLPYIFVRYTLVGCAIFILLMILKSVNIIYPENFFLYMTIFLLLPPPYILPISISKSEKKEISFFSGANVYATVISFLLIFIVLLIDQLGL